MSSISSTNIERTHKGSSLNGASRIGGKDNNVRSYSTVAKDLMLKAVDPRNAAKLAVALAALAAPAGAAAGRPDRSSCVEAFSALNGTKAFSLSGPCSFVTAQMNSMSDCNIARNASAVSDAVVEVANYVVSLKTNLANNASYWNAWLTLDPNQTAGEQFVNLCVHNSFDEEAFAFGPNTSDRGLIVGLVAAGGAVALAGIAAGVVCLLRRNNRKRSDATIVVDGSQSNVELSKSDVAVSV